MKKNLLILALCLGLAGLLAISLPGSPVQMINIQPVATPAQLAPTLPPPPTSAAPATFTPHPTQTLTPPPTLTPVPTKAPNPYLDILQPLAERDKEWVQIPTDQQIPANAPVLIVDLRKHDGVYVQVSVHFNPSMPEFMDRDLGSNWNGANKNGNEYERLAFIYADKTLPTKLKVATCKMAYAFYMNRLPITNAEVEMNVGPLQEAKQDDRGFVKLLEIFTANPVFDCDGHSGWNFFQTPTPLPTATLTPTP